MSALTANDLAAFARDLAAQSGIDETQALEIVRASDEGVLTTAERYGMPLRTAAVRIFGRIGAWVGQREHVRRLAASAPKPVPIPAPAWARERSAPRGPPAIAWKPSTAAERAPPRSLTLISRKRETTQ